MRFRYSPEPRRQQIHHQLAGGREALASLAGVGHNHHHKDPRWWRDHPRMNARAGEDPRGGAMTHLLHLHSDEAAPTGSADGRRAVVVLDLVVSGEEREQRWGLAWK